MTRPTTECSDCAPAGSATVTRRTFIRVTAALAALTAVPDVLAARAEAAAPPEPVGLRLPLGCSVVGSGQQIGPAVFTWRVDCGPGRSARTALGPALAAQGWVPCSSGLGTGSAVRAGLLTSVAESTGRPGEYARLTQWPNPPYSCGQPKVARQ